MKRRISRLWEEFWQRALSYTAITVVVIGMLWWRLGTLVPGLAQPELLARAQANGFYKLFDDPLFLPHKLIQYVFLRFGGEGAFWMRSASALFGLAIVILFYNILRNWYSRRVAMISTFLLLSSAWFLHFARLGTPEIMYALTIGLMWVGIRLKSVRAPRIRSLLASLLIFVTCLYVPGLAWLIVPLLIWQRRLIWHEFRKIKLPYMILSIIGVIIALLPLLYGLVRHPSLLRGWLFLPNTWSLAELWSNLWHLPLWLVLRGPDLPVRWLGHVPLFDVFSLVMLGLGCYVLAHYRRLDRVRAIVIVGLLAAVMTVLNGWIALVIALPVVYLVITAGVALLLQQWFTVFPRNPLARWTGLAMVILVVAFAGYYNIRHYFIAWPGNAQTRQVFGILDK